MNKAGLHIIGAAAVAGIAGNLLLRQTPWGLNAFLFVAAFVAGLVLLWRMHRPEMLTRTNVALVSAMIFFASMFLIRDAEELLVFNTFAIITIMGVVMLSSVGIRAHIAGTMHYIFGVIGAGLSSAFGGFFLLGADIDWKTIPGGAVSKNVFAVMRGVAVALPLLLIFGGLFMAADAVFEGWVNRAINFDIATLISHVVVTSILAWLTAGYFRMATIRPGFASSEDQPTDSESVTPRSDKSSYVADLADEPSEDSGAIPSGVSILEHINRTDDPVAEAPVGEATPEMPEPKSKRDWQNIDSSKLPSVFTLGTVETSIIFGLVNLLFLGFVITQVPYLFGGIELVRSTPDLKLADYALRGFGELIAVSMLVLPMLLLSHWLVRKDSTKASIVFRVLAGVQVALLFVIMASAAQRLMLLTGELGYGLTTDRFFAMPFMIWLAIVFAWFAAVVLIKGARQHFAWGALWTAVVVLAGTNLINPHAFIVQTNLQLMQQGRDFDGLYNVSLSADAVPALVEALPLFSPQDACVARMRLRNRTAVLTTESSDLRSWNLSRSRALSRIAAEPSISNEAAVGDGCSHLADSPRSDQ